MWRDNMAQFCITINDVDVNRVITAICSNYGYHAEIDNPAFDHTLDIDAVTNPELIPNPETAYQFANRMTRNFLTDHTKAYEIDLAKKQIASPTSPDITDPAII